MPRVSAPNCPGCNAPLQVRPDLAVVRCEYCGREVMVKHTQFQPPPVQPPPLQHRTPPPHGRPPVLPRRRRTHIGLALAISGMSVAFAAGMITYVMSRVRAATVSPVAAGRLPTTASGASAAAAEESGSWEDIEAGVLPAQVNADGVEDFLIRFQRSGAKRPLFVVAVDGASFARIWTAGPFGEDSDASTYSRVAASKKHVLITDSSSRAHIVDLATGRQLAEVPMSDRADRVCTEPGGEQGWIQVADRKHLMVDLSTGNVAAQIKPPRWCAEPFSWKMTGCTHYAGTAVNKGNSRARCIDVPNRWRIDGFGNSYAFKTERGYVAVGSKSPGTSFPILVGVDPLGKVKWRRGVSDDDGNAVEKETPKLVDVVGDLIVVAYKLENDRWRLAALDEATGATRWQRDLTEETHWGSAFTVSEKRVYIMLSRTLAVHDLATGNQLAVLKSP
jgi:outer membrane protein assembly factor BamB